ncbi:TPA: GIY-YIG nuclease family protein [Vibrio parahaemolyticus]|nr:GIY-YIG nuclease family protein [Vibrio parahaemolyticus]HCH2612534.1 GIY-YIG nuclease family protein [Vibrio parahaemolyticus]HCM1322168.1 GIY-YIG nuclease family protein [Vibrio parahaemolyticus]
MSHYLYVIGPKDGPLKIGIGKNVYRRRGQLNTGSYQYLHIHHIETLNSVSEAEELESTLHYFYESKHIRGEWFELYPSDLPEIKKQIDLAGNESISWLPSGWNISRKACDRFTPSVYKKIRLALNKTHKQVAAATNGQVPESTLINFESGSGTLTYIYIEHIIEFFTSQGVEFISQGDNKPYRILI